MDNNTTNSTQSSFNDGRALNTNTKKSFLPTFLAILSIILIIGVSVFVVILFDKVNTLSDSLDKIQNQTSQLTTNKTESDNTGSEDKVESASTNTANTEKNLEKSCPSAIDAHFDGEYSDTSSYQHQIHIISHIDLKADGSYQEYTENSDSAFSGTYRIFDNKLQITVPYNEMGTNEPKEQIVTYTINDTCDEITKPYDNYNMLFKRK